MDCSVHHVEKTDPYYTNSCTDTEKNKPPFIVTVVNPIFAKRDPNFKPKPFKAARIEDKTSLKLFNLSGISEEHAPLLSKSKSAHEVGTHYAKRKRPQSPKISCKKPEDLIRSSSPNIEEFLVMEKSSSKDKELKSLSSIKSIPFNHLLVKELNKIPKLSVKTIEEAAYRYCREKMVETFQEIEKISCGMVQNTEEELSKEILEELKKNSYLVKVVVRYLENWDKVISDFQEKKQEYSPKSQALQSFISKLIKSSLSEGKIPPSEKMAKLLQKLLKNKEPEKKLFLLFGDNIQEIITILCPQYHHFFTQIKEMVHNYNWELVTLANIKSRVHYWEEGGKNVRAIADISLNDIRRDFYTDGCFHFEQFTINGHSLIPFFSTLQGSNHQKLKITFKAILDVCFNPKNISKYQLKNFKEPFDNLPDCMGLLDREVTEDEIKKIVKHLTKKEALFFEKGENAELKIAEDLLRLCTNSCCWAHANTFLRELYPNLFKSPYGSQVQSGNECQIKIFGAGNFSVSLKKKYHTYPLLFPDTDRHVFDRDKLQMKTSVKWELYPRNQNSRVFDANLTISDIKIHEEVSDSHSRKCLLNSFSSYEQIEDQALLIPLSPRKKGTKD